MSRPIKGLQSIWQALTRRSGRAQEKENPPGQAGPVPRAKTQTLDIAPTDPLVAYFQDNPNAVELSKLDFESPGLSALRAAGVKLTVPLVSQGELVGLLNLGPRMSQQEYSADDRSLLDNLAVQAGPAVRVAQLVRQQQADVQVHERLEQELRVARLIQQTLLPKETPAITGWQLAATYCPARAVGGDFYDFIQLPGRRLGIVIGDVTDKGVPAALMMATTRATLRSAAQQVASPGEVLSRVNNQICPEIPPKMFVTCFYAILDPATGRLHYANAGHDIPYCQSGRHLQELRATGMPLGLMPNMQYEEREVMLKGGDTVLFYTDGLVEAHSPDREMFGFPRLKSLLAESQGGAPLIDRLLAELAAFTGADWEQEDDVSLVTLECLAEPVYVRPTPGDSSAEAASEEMPSEPSAHTAARQARALADEPEITTEATPAEPLRGPERRSAIGKWEGRPGGGLWRTLADFELPSAPGNERQAIERVSAAVAGLGLSTERLDRLKTAVGEATMNAMEHGNRYQADLPAEIHVLASSQVLVVQVTDHSGDRIIPEPEAPDLEAKLAGLQSPRGWGLFLIRNLVDEMNVVLDKEHHTVELITYLQPEGA